jgi:hypothetical protein
MEPALAIAFSNHASFLGSTRSARVLAVAGALVTALACNGSPIKPSTTTETGPTTTGPTSESDSDGDGWTIAAGDCDDTNPLVNPSAVEVSCDSLDNDCKDGDVEDADGDGFACVEVGGGDCDDGDSTAYPGASDLCYDGRDTDCGGGDDYDCDRDGYPSADYGGNDCDDTEGEVHAKATEVCWDGLDNDCDPVTPDCDCDGDGYEASQCGGPDCEDTDLTINPGAEDVCYDGLDADCGGEDDADCDGDGYGSADLGGDDCDDVDPLVNPGAFDVCHDDIDNDCDATTGDCDCDGDSFSDVSCGGSDCDDSEATAYPGALDNIADDIDNDCDGAVDEDAYCNVYFPLSNGPSAEWTYQTEAWDGYAYTETVTISAWSAGSGTGTLSRSFAGPLAFTVDEEVKCIAGTVSQTGVTADHPTYAGTASYSRARTLLQPAASLVPGATWTYNYDATVLGLITAWSASGTYRVVGTATVSVGAGTFDAVVVENDYQVTDSFYGDYEGSGVITLYYVEKLGLVYAEDRSDAGTIREVRELTSYSGFYP